ncbi:MAG: XrtA/PEP-CTERM system exopolysaccharide export protein [Thiohalomonadaceae bacterium]
MDARKLAAMAVFVAALTGCAAGGDRRSGDTATDAKATESQEYRIGVDDLVAVNVWRDEELSVTMPVRPDGKITVPLIGDVQAGGRTPQEVAKEIRTRLSAYIRNPDVTVILTELRSHQFLSRIRVTGAVEQPMSMPYRQGMTALDAVLEAGGINAFAAPDRTKVFRRSQNGETKIFNVFLGRILTQGDLGTNLDLRPGDVITIPERLF